MLIVLIGSLSIQANEPVECNTCNTCCCSPCCCELCDFVPPCPPDICAYNAPVEIDIRCGWDFYVTASFLYLQAKEENLEYISAGSMPVESGTVTMFEITEFALNWQSGGLSFGYEPGFRVGLGFNFGCDNWAFNAQYFRYHADVGSGSFSLSTNGLLERVSAHLLWAPLTYLKGSPAGVVSTSNTLTDPFQPASFIIPQEQSIDPSFTYEGDPTLTISSNAKWRLEMDFVDLSLDRKYYVGRCLKFNSFFGLRAGWMEQKYEVNYLVRSFSVGGFPPPVLALVPEDLDYSVTATTQSWAIGPRLGVDSEWTFSRCFFLFGDASVSVLYTDYDKIKIKSDVEITNYNILDNNASGSVTQKIKLCCLRPQADISLGFGWADYVCCNDWFVDFRVGYEFQVYWNQNVFNKNFALGQSSTETFGDLYLHGLAITARLDF